MYFKKPHREHYELVAVVRVYVLQKRADGNLDVRFELADGSTLDSIYTLAEYAELLAEPRGVIV